MTKLTFEVERDFPECQECDFNPKNMDFWNRIKRIFRPSITCDLCTGEKIIRKIRKTENEKDFAEDRVYAIRK